MADTVKRLAALNEIRQNIAKLGYHTYVVTGGGYPHYGYTIGLTAPLGAELILAGAYFYRLDEVPKVIKSVAANLESPAQWENKTIKSDSLGRFSLRKVHSSWASSLMLGVFDYYQVEAIQAYQIVPDEAHWSLEIPNLSMPRSPEATPAWQWLDKRWTYPVPRDSVALTNLDALRGKRITEVMRWEEDQWEIFAGVGPDTTEAERRVAPIGVLLAADPSLLPAVNLAVGTGLIREPDSDWRPWGASEEEARSAEVQDGP